MITKYGYGTVGTIAFLVFIVLALSFFLNNPYLKYGFITLGVGFMLFTLYFFRDPDRTTPAIENAIFSPADGKILAINETTDERFIGGECWQISIFMSPLNVHVNRIPIDGSVGYFNYHKGEYLVAFHDKADERNERTEIGIDSKFGRVLYTQVAGFVARRIVCNLEEGDIVKAGDKFGMIKFGSRSDVFVSKDWDVKVKVGDHVTAGETILYKHER